MKYKLSSKARAWRKGKELGGGQRTKQPSGHPGYQAFGFCLKGAGKLLKGFLQEQGSGLYVQNSMRGSEGGRHYVKERIQDSSQYGIQTKYDIVPKKGTSLVQLSARNEI